MAAHSARRNVALPASEQSRIVLRPAREADIATIAEIEKASFSDPWTAASFKSLLVVPAVHFVVAADDARVMGYLVMWLAADEAEVANLAVSDSARRRKVGSTLIAHAMDTARASGASVMFLEVRESNVAARELYASHGFAEVGRRKRYYRRPEEDALVLRRDLQENRSFRK